MTSVASVRVKIKNVYAFMMLSICVLSNCMHGEAKMFYVKKAKMFLARGERMTCVITILELSYFQSNVFSIKLKISIFFMMVSLL